MRKDLSSKQIPEKGERIHVDLIVDTSKSDRSYPALTHMALEELLEWLQGGTSDWGLVNFRRTLADMKNRREFQPAHQSNQREPMVVGGRLEYREPVWNIVHETAAKYSPTYAMTQEGCAEWLESTLELASKYRTTKKLVDEFTGKLGKEEVIFVLGEEGVGAVRIVLDPVMSGENASKTLTSIVERLIGELSVRIEQMGS